MRRQLIVDKNAHMPGFSAGKLTNHAKRIITCKHTSHFDTDLDPVSKNKYPVKLNNKQLLTYFLTTARDFFNGEVYSHESRLKLLLIST